MKSWSQIRWSLIPIALVMAVAELQYGHAQVGSGNVRTEVVERRVLVGDQAAAANTPTDPAPHDPWGNSPFAVPTVGVRFVPPANQALEKAINALRDAKDDESKSQAQAELRDVLAKQFQQDMKRREASLKTMQERLQKLREQLDRRNEKQKEIIDLQLQVLSNEADGLGFYSVDPTAVPQSRLFFNPDDSPQYVPGNPRAPTPAVPVPALPAEPVAPNFQIRPLSDGERPRRTNAPRISDEPVPRDAPDEASEAPSKR